MFRKIVSVLVAVSFIMSSVSYSFADIKPAASTLSPEARTKPMTIENSAMLDIMKIKAEILNEIAKAGNQIPTKDAYKELTIDAIAGVRGGDQIVIDFRSAREASDAKIFPCSIREKKEGYNEASPRNYLAVIKVVDGAHKVDVVPLDAALTVPDADKTSLDGYLSYLAKPKVQEGIDNFVKQQEIDRFIAKEIKEGRATRLTFKRAPGATNVALPAGTIEAEYLAYVEAFLESIGATTLRNQFVDLVHRGQIMIIPGLKAPHAGGAGIYLSEYVDYHNAWTVLHEVCAKAGFAHVECKAIESAYHNIASRPQVECTDFEKALMTKLRTASFENRWTDVLKIDYNKLGLKKEHKGIMPVALIDEMKARHDRRWHLGIDSSTQSTKFVVTDALTHKVIWEWVENYSDEFYKEFGTVDGVLPNADDRAAYTDPLMIAAAIAKGVHEMQREFAGYGWDMKNIKTIQPTAQQHGTVYLNERALEILSQLDPISKTPLHIQIKDALARRLSPMWQNKETKAQSDKLRAFYKKLNRFDTDEATDTWIRNRMGSGPAELRFPGLQAMRFAEEEAKRTDGKNEFNDTKHIINIAGFIGGIFSGRLAWDMCEASASLIFDIRTKKWIPRHEMESLCPGLYDKLPDVFPSTEKIGKVTNGWRKFGFHQDTDVVNAGGDNPSGSMGQAMLEEGDISASVGTSLVIYIKIHSEEQLNRMLESNLGSIMITPDGKYMKLVCFQNGALALKSLRDKYITDEMAVTSLETRIGTGWDNDLTTDQRNGMIDDEKWRIFTEKALEVKPDAANGVMITQNMEEDAVKIPYVDGMYYSADLDTSNNPENLGKIFRAAMEGQALFLRWVAQQLNLDLTTIKSIRLTGGGTKNPVICQAMADAFGVEIVTADINDFNPEAVALGAAAVGEAAELMANGTPVEDAFKTATGSIKLKHLASPDKDNVEKYKALSKKYATLVEEAQKKGAAVYEFEKELREKFEAKMFESVSKMVSLNIKAGDMFFDRLIHSASYRFVIVDEVKNRVKIDKDGRAQIFLTTKDYDKLFKGGDSYALKGQICNSLANEIGRQLNLYENAEGLNLIGAAYTANVPTYAGYRYPAEAKQQLETLKDQELRNAIAAHWKVFGQLPEYGSYTYSGLNTNITECLVSRNDKRKVVVYSEKFGSFEISLAELYGISPVADGEIFGEDEIAASLDWVRGTLSAVRDAMDQEEIMGLNISYPHALPESLMKDGAAVALRQYHDKPTRVQYWLEYRSRHGFLNLTGYISDAERNARKTITEDSLREELYNIRMAKAVSTHEEAFGVSPQGLAVGPGRINLSEHTDYAGGLVMPIALDGVNVMGAISKRADGKIALYSPRFGRYEITIGDLSRISPNANASKYSINEADSWARYPLGVIRQLMARGIDIGNGLNLSYDGNVPVGGGLSSSAAVESAVVKSIEEVLGIGLDEKLEAEVCQKAEHWLGNMCGIMDQYSSLNGASMLNCNTLESKPLDLSFLDVAGYVLVAADTGLPKTKEAWNRYNERLKELDRAVNEFLKARYPKIQTRLDIAPNLSVEEFEKIEMDLEIACGEKVRMRVEHVVYEEARVHEIAELIDKANAYAAKYNENRIANSADLTSVMVIIRGIGEIVSKGHESLRDLYEMSSDHLNQLVESAENYGSVGSRFTGAGVVGGTVNIVKKGDLKRFRDGVVSEYKARFGTAPKITVARPGAGAKSIQYGPQKTEPAFTAHSMATDMMPAVQGAPVTFLALNLLKPVPAYGFSVVEVIGGTNLMGTLVGEDLEDGVYLDGKTLEQVVEMIRNNPDKAYALAGQMIGIWPNRVSGELMPDGKTLKVTLPDGRFVYIPANETRPDGSKNALHFGLHWLAQKVRHWFTPNAATVEATAVVSGDGERPQYPSDGIIKNRTTLTKDGVIIREATFTNTDTQGRIAPVAFTEHMYHKISEGPDMNNVRLAMNARALVEGKGTLPTGRIEIVGGTNSKYDFTAPNGAPLGDLDLDNCFTDLTSNDDGTFTIRVIDEKLGRELVITASGKMVDAKGNETNHPIGSVQVYMPRKGFICIEPSAQRVTDPLNKELWGDNDTGMAMVKPGETYKYQVKFEYKSIKKAEPQPVTLARNVATAVAAANPELLGGLKKMNVLAARNEIVGSGNRIVAFISTEAGTKKEYEELFPKTDFPNVEFVTVSQREFADSAAIMSRPEYAGCKKVLVTVGLEDDAFIGEVVEGYEELFKNVVPVNIEPDFEKYTTVNQAAMRKGLLTIGLLSTALQGNAEYEQSNSYRVLKPILTEIFGSESEADIYMLNIANPNGAMDPVTRFSSLIRRMIGPVAKLVVNGVTQIVNIFA